MQTESYLTSYKVTVQTVHKANGTNSPVMVQKVHGMKHPGYEKSTNGKLEKVALNGSVECCAPPPQWCDLELWPFDPKT